MFRFVSPLAAAVVLSACATTAPDNAASARDGLVITASAHSVAETADRVEAVVIANGATVFARVDHAGGAAKINQPLPPTQLILFGNPNLGTPILQRSRTTGLDLPAHVLIWSEDGTTWIGHVSGTEFARRHGLDPNDPDLAKLMGAVEAIAARAAAAD